MLGTGNDQTREATPFLEPASVEAWDAWYRWRAGHEVCDRTVRATFDRVAGWLAAAEPRDAARWFAAFRSAMAGFRVLPDERILRDAGTDRARRHTDDLAVVVNVAAHVRAGAPGHATFDGEGFERAVVIAVRMLDDALAACAAGPARGGGVGLIGLGDALALLGLAYDSPEARDRVAAIGRHLAQAALAASVELARERGPQLDASSLDATLRRAVADAIDPRLVEQARRHGLRAAGRRTITAQPGLALLANAVTDALDPADGAVRTYRIDAPERPRVVHTVGFAARRQQRESTAAGRAPASATVRPAAPEAQIALRAALQSWVDAPIDLPLLTVVEPDPVSRRELAGLARARGLPPPRYRVVAAP